MPSGLAREARAKISDLITEMKTLFIAGAGISVNKFLLSDPF